MCRPADPYCWHNPAPIESTDTLDTLDKPVSFDSDPTTATKADDTRRSGLPPSPAGLSRALFFPKHTSKVTHLPIYEVGNAYNEAVKDAPLGSGMYKINMMFMRRPKGDGTDSDVEFFVDVANDGTFVTIHQRSLVLDEGLTITM
ncbi:hypothetical protein CORC01_04816 [Colletotrichum orchidophilum]|uniref:Uncharacterized protein n=1 Tax=Colletotrichum orchidophilum TaxID=1209926 RepID=A0A1G4BEY9_9PEZI|nr:uncharacterized protein CORC01_04816 [Colletotrichum orchidophilum]OHE99915.1 hypothetical protein CORC01_04816 [Colletotrichum orchidophilum]